MYVITTMAILFLSLKTKDKKLRSDLVLKVHTKNSHNQPNLKNPMMVEGSNQKFQEKKNNKQIGLQKPLRMNCTDRNTGSNIFSI